MSTTMITYKHITLPERRKISDWLDKGLSIDNIAANLGRHRSTIYREVRRNYSHLPDYNISGYYHIAANHAAQDRIKSRCKLHKVTDLTRKFHEKAQTYVEQYQF